MASVIEAIASRLESRATKSINEVLREYRNTLELYVVDAANGNLRSGAMSRRMRELVIASGEAVYVEGLREGGGDGELEKTDRDAVRDWTLSQTAHINDFVDAAIAVAKLKGDEKTAARNAILDRVRLWVDNLNLLGQLAAGSVKDPMVTWEWSPEKEHCNTCAQLNGKRHKLSWFVEKGYIPQERGSETLECGGWECGCKLIDDKGKQRLP